MSTLNATAEPGLNVNVSVLKPERGDLIALRFPGHLSRAHRDMVEAHFKPLVSDFGCRFVVLDGGADLLLVKQPAPEGA